MSVRLSGPPQGARIGSLDLEALETRAQQILGAIGHPRSELSVALVDDPTIAGLNAQWRGRRRATDVLSFSLVEGEHASRRGRLLGDVVIGVETATRQARQRHRSLDEVVARLLIHGVLHLLGHDHVEGADARRMRREELRLWRLIRA